MNVNIFSVHVFEPKQSTLQKGKTYNPLFSSENEVTRHRNAEIINIIYIKYAMFPQTSRRLCVESLPNSAGLQPQPVVTFDCLPV
jgi:hypothetical protein